MADSIPKYFDAEIRPPIGGWHYYYNPNDRNTLVKKSTPTALIDEIFKFRQLNAPTSKEVIEAEVWNYWCSLDPTRCGIVPAGTPSGPYLPLDHRPSFFGPIIWRYMNLASVRFNEIGRDYWIQQISKASDLMSCPNCRTHWQELLDANPPAVVFTMEDACKWVFDRHNEVNAATGKVQYTWPQFVREYGAPITQP